MGRVLLRIARIQQDTAGCRRPSRRAGLDSKQNVKTSQRSVDCGVRAGTIVCPWVCGSRFAIGQLYISFVTVTPHFLEFPYAICVEGSLQVDIRYEFHVL